MGKVAFLFSGQGAQKPGMGTALFGIPEVDAVFDCAQEAFGFDVAGACAHAAAHELNDTAVAQPALCALSVACAHALRARGVTPDYVAGFSLGQIAALEAAGMLGLSETFALAAHRARVMAEAAAASDGAMCALLGGTAPEVEALCEQEARGQVLAPANYNAPGQVVVSGERPAVERARDAWAGPGRKSAMLATSGAFHSPLMQPAPAALAAYLETVTFSEAAVPLVCNVDARPLAAADAREHLAAQVTNPVRFQQSVEWLLEQGVDTFVECGFGGVLCGLVRKVDKTARRFRVETPEDLEAVVEALS